MNKRTKLTIGIGLTVLLLAAVFATAAFAQGPGGAFGGMMNGWNRQGYGPGMMGGQAFGGMMGGWGQQGSDASAGVPANCPMFGAANPANAQPIAFDKAVEAVRAVPEELQ